MARVHRLEWTPPDAGQPDDGEDDVIEVRGQQFKLVTTLPGSYIMRLGVLGEASATERIAHVNRTINALVAPEDRGRFLRLLDTAEPAMPLSEIVHYMNEMVEIVSGRPTQGQSTSPPGLPETPTGSTDNGGPVPATPEASAV